MNDAVANHLVAFVEALRQRLPIGDLVEDPHVEKACELVRTRLSLLVLAFECVDDRLAHIRCHLDKPFLADRRRHCGVEREDRRADQHELKERLAQEAPDPTGLSSR